MVSVERLRADARQIFSAGIIAADPLAGINKHVILLNDHLRVAGRRYDLSRCGNLYVVGCGKGTARMALALERLLGNRIAAGLVVVKYGHQLPLDRVVVLEAGHPIPDQAGVDAAQRIVELARSCGENDLLFVLISGGGSALLPCPVEGVSLTDMQRVTEMLLDSGAAIQEVNAVRKHMSRLKGGRLAGLAAPAQLIALILSDVVGDALDVIASGPTVPDSSTFADGLEIIRRYKLGNRIPAGIIDYLERGARGEIAETPKRGEAVFSKVQNVIIGNNRMALQAAQVCAQDLGYRTRILSDAIEGESRVVARSHAALMKKNLRREDAKFCPMCILSGGETTVKVCGDGQGGRNQEFALAAAIEIDKLDGAVILSGGTDGGDGLTDAAGGIVDGATLSRGRAMGLDAVKFLERNDSHHFLQATEDLLTTGPTFTNVMDMQIMLMG